MTPTIVYLDSGAIVIGLWTFPDHATSPLLLNPYEVLATPHPDTGKLNVTLMKFGSLYGVLQGLDQLKISHTLPIAQPPDEMLRQYQEIVKRHVNIKEL